MNAQRHIVTGPTRQHVLSEKRTTAAIMNHAVQIVDAANAIRARCEPVLINADDIDPDTGLEALPGSVDLGERA